MHAYVCHGFRPFATIGSVANFFRRREFARPGFFVRLTPVAACAGAMSLEMTLAPASRRGRVLTQQDSLATDLESGSTTKAEGAAVRGDHLDPQCILVLEVRGVAGLPQRIKAGLLRTRGCGVEARQLEDHPRAFVQLRQPEGHGRSLSGHLDLGTGSYVGTGQGVVLAIAAENHWRFSRRTAGATTRPATAGTCARATTTDRTAGTRRGALARTGYRASSRSGTRCARRTTTSASARTGAGPTAARTRASTTAGGAANIQTADIASAVGK